MDQATQQNAALVQQAAAAADAMRGETDKLNAAVSVFAAGAPGRAAASADAGGRDGSRSGGKDDDRGGGKPARSQPPARMPPALPRPARAERKEVEWEEF
ncbi:hypothetical protein [Duganella sp.]|uniref:hypothetical protein n=1 Tax=Duganella sp. TaxID=1904440 RepID=UPI0031D44FD8